MNSITNNFEPLAASSYLRTFQSGLLHALRLHPLALFTASVHEKRLHA